jgi:hypothetical protein
MKNIKTILALTCVVIIFVISCNKQEDVALPSVSTSSNNYTEEQIANAVINFGKKVKMLSASGIKGQAQTMDAMEDLIVDSAIWLLEAELNYIHDDTTVYENPSRDTAVFEIPASLEEGTYLIKAADAINSYIELDAQVQAHLDNISEEYKSVVAVDLSEGAPEINEVGDTVIIFEMISLISANPTPSFPICEFSGNNNWWWAYGQFCAGGRCDGTGNKCTDAAIEIMKKLNSSICRPQFGCSSGGRVFYTDVTLTDDIWHGHTGGVDDRNPNDPSTLDNYLDWLLYFNTNSFPNYIDQKCLYDYELNYYKNAAILFAERYKQEYFPGYTTISYKIYGDDVQFQGIFEGLMIYQLTVGKPHCVINPN